MAMPWRTPGRRPDGVDGHERRVVAHRRAAIDEALAVDAVGGPWEGLQAVRRDRLAAAQAGAVGPGIEPGERRLDELELLGRPVAQGQVALLLEDLGGRRGLGAVRHLAGRRRSPRRARRAGDHVRRRGCRAASVGGRRPIAGVSVIGDCILPGSTELEDVRWRSRSIPVCGMEVDSATSFCRYEYDGTTYWFCGKGCLLEFKDDPEKYLVAGPRPDDVRAERR